MGVRFEKGGDELGERMRQEWPSYVHGEVWSLSSGGSSLISYTRDSHEVKEALVVEGFFRGGWEVLYGGQSHPQSHASRTAAAAPPVNLQTPAPGRDNFLK